MNKYKNKANKLNIKEGEVALTYGVQYLDHNEKKSSIKPARPYLVLKKEDDIYYSLKCTTKNNKFLNDFKIEVDKYPYNEAIVRDSYVQPEFVYELQISDFIQNGIVLTKKDLLVIYKKLLKSYFIDEVEVPNTLLNSIYKDYIAHKKIFPGTMLMNKAFDGHLLVIDEDEKNYICLPAYRDGERNFDEVFRFYKYNNYICYNELYLLPKDEFVYLTHYSIDQSLFNYIKSRVDETQKIEGKQLILNKDLS